MRALWIMGALATALAISSCGGDGSAGFVDSPVVTVAINSMNESDIDPPGIIEKDENISNQTGNPWGEFIQDVEAECGGLPSAFEVLWVSLTLDAAGSQNVDELEDVITGQATVFFSSTRGSDPIAIRVNVASSASVAGVGPVVMGVVADSSDLSVLYGRLVGGDFHVGLRGVTDRTGSDDFSMDVRVSVRATAFCD